MSEQSKLKAGCMVFLLANATKAKIRNVMHVIFAHACRHEWLQIGWHSFRRTFATLLKGSGEDVKTTQELMRHANSRLTLDVSAQALAPAKRAAHLKVVELI